MSEIKGWVHDTRHISQTQERYGVKSNIHVHAVPEGAVEGEAVVCLHECSIACIAYPIIVTPNATAMVGKRVRYIVWIEGE